MEDLCDPGMIIKSWPNADPYPAFGEALAEQKQQGGVLLCGHGYVNQREGKTESSPKRPL